ncbi:MAG: L-aspartate oxidase [Bacteroidia bacterium]
MRHRVDILVIGSGVAGLFFALKAARHGNVLIITKEKAEESNTAYAQGGIATVWAESDSYEKHIEDTLTAGDGLSQRPIVEKVIRAAASYVQELIEYGVTFDKDEKGNYILGREGGHSHPRILHSKDATGAAISDALLKAVRTHPRIQLWEGFFALDLLTQHHLGMYVNRNFPDLTCYGVYALEEKTGHVWTILSKVTVLATGGAGQVYQVTTNPYVATGDGIGMALRAKARLANMEFYQFHPTAFYEPNESQALLITEAMRGEGATLLNPRTYQRFMADYDDRAELAPRDIVARSIDAEMKKTGIPYVYLDARNIPEVKNKFPTIAQACSRRGIDIQKDLIPVAPAAHYMCGGIDVDEFGRTSIRNLYAIGETSHTGLHGANRLASNSLLESLVFAGEAAQDVAYHLSVPFCEEIPAWHYKESSDPNEFILISHNLHEVRSIMSNYVGIVRSNFRLARAQRRLALLFEETEAFYQQVRVSRPLFELRNLIAVAYLIVKSAQLRKESRGLHYTMDYPNKKTTAWNTYL